MPEPPVEGDGRLTPAHLADDCRQHSLVFREGQAVTGMGGSLDSPIRETAKLPGYSQIARFSLPAYSRFGGLAGSGFRARRQGSVSFQGDEI